MFLTEAEPLYLGETFQGLIAARPHWLEPAAVAVLDFTPFGTRGTVPARAIRLARTFGLRTSVKTALHIAGQWLRPSSRLAHVLRLGGIELTRVPDVAAPELCAMIDRIDPDAIVAVGLNRVVPASMLGRGRAAWINVHLGLLPRHRGPAPLFWALHDGDAETGVSVHMMVERVDAGAILAQTRRPIGERRLYAQLRQLRKASIDVLYEALERFRRDDVPPASDLPLPPAHRAPKRADVVRFLGTGNRFL